MGGTDSPLSPNAGPTGAEHAGALQCLGLQTETAAPLFVGAHPAFETLAIADDSSRDYVKTTGVDGKVTWVFDKENFARQRLRIKARKMILARMAPSASVGTKLRSEP
jgi:hypothetical protein